MFTNNAVKSGLIQSVTSSREVESYQTDGDGTETKDADIKLAQTDTQSPQGKPASPSAWVTTTVYAAGDVVTESSVVYECREGHTAGTFATDLAAGKWEILLYGGNKAFGVLITDEAGDG